jgi:hypothetical protein
MRKVEIDFTNQEDNEKYDELILPFIVLSRSKVKEINIHENHFEQEMLYNKLQIVEEDDNSLTFRLIERENKEGKVH